MSNQVRELATKSINSYVEFFRRFKRADGKYPTPQEIVKRDYDPDTPFEQTFLTLKLEIVGKEKEQEIRFEKDLSEVRNKLVEIVDLMIERINRISRADTQIANSSKTHLWDIEKKDEIVIKAKDEIKKILDENLEITKKTLNIYDNFVFLLREGEKIREFLEKKQFNREDFEKRIMSYIETIILIKEKCPYEIRLNMFLIQTEELNNRLVELCEKHIQTYVNAIKNYVYVDEASAVSQSIRDIQNKFSNMPKDTKALVQSDEFYKDVENREKQIIMHRYQDLIEWLMFLQMLPQPKFQETQEDEKNPLLNLHTIYQGLPQNIEKQAQALD